MYILNTDQIRAADVHTIQNEPITSADLMERAADAFYWWLLPKLAPKQSIAVFCGMGNNGGDGLCVARMLHHTGFPVTVYKVRFSAKSSVDFKINEKRLAAMDNVPIVDIFSEKDIPSLAQNTLIIDALFGSGLARPITGFTATLVAKINQSGCKIIAIDVPSGLYADKVSEGIVIEATETVSFQLPKLAFMLPENHRWVGDWHTVNIGLDADFIKNQNTTHFYTTKATIQAMLRPKFKFAHKGTNGHTLMIGGSYGKIGATVLATHAALKAGAGLVTTYVPKCGYTILQIAVPEAMCLTDVENDFISQMPPIERYNAIAIGPGLGQHSSTEKALLTLLQTAQQPLVLDADALNIIAKNQWHEHIPPNSILTPHPKEFERLVGKTANHFERLERQRAFAQKYNIHIVLKGAHTCVMDSQGNAYFNSTGNPAMATGGSGDVLTGIIAAFLSQGYSARESAILGVYFHGLAGDRAAVEKGSIIARDLIEAFRFV